MRVLVLILVLLCAPNAIALEVPRPQCSEAQGFGLPFGEHASARDVRRALRTHRDFTSLLINDGDTARAMYRATAIARYETPDQAEAMMQLMFANLLDSGQFPAEFADGYIDESLENGITLYSGDYELNEGVAMQITREHASVLVTCTDLQGRAAVLTASARQKP